MSKVSSKRTNSRVSGFMSAKQLVLKALDYRINNLSKMRRLLKDLHDGHTSAIFQDTESKLDELTTLRTYVKGMVIKT